MVVPSSKLDHVLIWDSPILRDPHWRVYRQVSVIITPCCPGAPFGAGADHTAVADHVGLQSRSFQGLRKEIDSPWRKIENKRKKRWKTQGEMVKQKGNYNLFLSLSLDFIHIYLSL